MVMAANPYRPGFGQVPEVLAGRDPILESARHAADTVAEGRTPRPLILVGQRGVGKTVVIAEIADRAGTERGWPTLQLEATPGAALASAVIDEARTIAALLDQSPPRARFPLSDASLRAGVAGVGAEVRPERAPDHTARTSRQVHDALAQLASAAARAGSGVLVAFDETQAAGRHELATLAAALQAGTRAHWPMVVVFAGLPTMRDATRTVTYLERAEWHEVGLLSATDTIHALVGPAVGAGRPFEPAAGQYLAAQTGGYPYAIQLYGHHAWIVSDGHDRIDLADAKTAARNAASELDAGLYASRWSQASPKEQQYLAALATVLATGERPTGSAVATQLGATPRQLSTHRDRLLTKGTLIAEGTELRFAIPGMADYVRRQPPPHQPSPRRTSPAPDQPTAQAQALRASRARRQPPRPDRGR